ncbi:MAG: FxsA family protein, partial [Pseudomonadota bacterium]
LFLLFVGMPLVELFLLLKVGGQIGALNTFAIVLVTCFLGAYLAKSQGRAIFTKIQAELNKGGVPADSMIQGLLVFVGGLLLITPGFVTDAFGFFFVVPFTRSLFIRAVKAHFSNAIASGKYKMYTNQGQGFPGGGGFRVYTYSNHSQRSSDTFQSGARPVRDVNPEVIDVSPKSEE